MTRARDVQRVTRRLRELLALALVLLACQIASAMSPPSGTALGIPSRNNSLPGYVHPLGGAYYLYSPLGGAGATWTVTPGSVMATDNMNGAATVQKLTGGYAKLFPGSQPPAPAGGAGWITVDVWVAGQIVDTGHYRLYEIEVLEDDSAGNGRGGYDPRYGTASGSFAEEGGFYHANGQAEPAAKDIVGYDDRLAGQGTEWTGTPLVPPRTEIRLPEAQLLPHQGTNSLVASRRDNQYVRIWLKGPRETIPFPAYCAWLNSAGIRLHPSPGSALPARRVNPGC